MAPVSFLRYNAVNGTLIKTTKTVNGGYGKSAILHIYRSLLRAATYLPDSLARSRIRGDIVNRFHQQKRRKTLPASWMTDLEKRVAELEGAADLEPQALASVLEHAYARKGARRRVLVTELLRCQEAVAPQEATLTGEAGAKGAQDLPRAFLHNAKLNALLASQKANTSHIERTKVKHLKPDIPKLNIWMRNTPVKVVRNKEKKWLVKVLSNICAPLPEDEWHRLEALSSGALQEAPPCQRSKASLSEIRSGREASVRGMLQRVRGHVEKTLLPVDNRGLRHIYNDIWVRTPLMTYDEERKLWDVQWGRSTAVARAGLSAVRVAKPVETELFEGVENLDVSMKGKRGKKIWRSKR